MSEKPIPPALPPAKPGATPPEAAAKTVPPGAQPAPAGGNGAPAASAPSLFGGHRGGGKKRADGLPAGSAEAKAADNAKAAARMAKLRADKKAAAIPAALPAVAASATNPAPSLAPDLPGLPGVAVDSLGAPAPVAGPAFVPWTARLLEKPARLLMKIVDRARCWQLTKRVKKLALDRDKEKEILDGFRWNEKAVEDFNQSLATAAEIELNKRRVGGSEYSHLINVALSAGELVYQHVQTMEILEKLALENQRKDEITTPPKGT